MRYLGMVVTGTMEFYDFPETVGNGMSVIIPTDFHSLTPSFFRGLGLAQPPAFSMPPGSHSFYATVYGCLEWTLGLMDIPNSAPRYISPVSRSA